MQTREIKNYGLIGPTTGGIIKWFGTPEALAEAWGDYPRAVLRLSYGDGRIGFGNAEEVQPVYDALNA